MPTETTATASDTWKVKLEMWLQYRSDLAARITQSDWKRGNNEEDRKEIMKTFMQHMAILQLNKYPLTSTEIIWGSGQIRVACIVDETAVKSIISSTTCVIFIIDNIFQPFLNVLRRYIAAAMAKIAVSKKLLPKCVLSWS
jgi:hypothetical protein